MTLNTHEKSLWPLDSAKKQAKLYVVSVISNPCRYRSRYELYRKFEDYVIKSGAELYTVELNFGNRPHVVTSVEDSKHIQVYTAHELWHKENMINIGISRLPSDWEYVAWIDADVTFARPDWVYETIQQLQHYHIVQMFSNAQDLSPDHEPIKEHTGFCYAYIQKTKWGKSTLSPYDFWHPGYAWAARREAIDHLGGLIDFAILGAADHHMAKALVGRVNESMPGNISDPYIEELLIWQQRAIKYIRYNIGYVPGLLLHYWHGKKKDRNYVERWDILLKNKFDPRLDLKKDWQGLYQLTERSYRLRDDIRSYMRLRNEDSIDLEDF